MVEMKWKITLILLIAGIIAFTSGRANSAVHGNMDVVLVMDSSGSMKKTDPHFLRIPAAKLFISLLDKNDRASVVSFSDEGYPIIYLTPVDSEQNRDRLFKAAERISSNGLYTNLYGALEKGLSVLEKNKKADTTRIIIFMSDGMMDVGNSEDDARLLNRIKDELAARLEEEEVKVYSIAFTEQSDRQLLEKISKRTGGFYNLALTDKDFHIVFTSIFESLKGPEMLPMSKNRFLIDGTIEEVTIVATKGSPDTQIQLNAPDGQQYSKNTESTGIDWFESDNFDMITVQKPREGRWEILFSTGENNKAYIITNLKLQTNFDQLYATFGDPLEMKLWLEKDGARITEQNLLDKFDLYIEITGPDGKISKLIPFSKGEGIFIRKIAPFTPGNYKLRVVARGNTFEREKSFMFNVADARESKEDVLIKRTKEKQVQEEAAKKIQEKAEPVPEEEITIDEIAWTKVIVQFVFVNIILGLIALLYFKRKSIKGLIKKNKGPVQGKPGEMKPAVTTDTQAQEKAVELTKEQGPTESPEENEQPKAQKQPPSIAQKEAGAAESRQEISLEEGESQITQDAPETQVRQEGEKETKQAISLDEEEDTPEKDNQEPQEETKDAAGPGEPEIEGADSETETDIKQEILSQDDLDQLLVSEDDIQEGDAAEMPDESLEELDKVNTDAQGQEPAKAAENSENEQVEDMDAMWQEALQTQKEAETKNTDSDQESTPDVQDKGDEDATQETLPPEVTEANAETEQQEDIDAMWQEALQSQKEAEAENSGPDEQENQKTALETEIERMEKQGGEDTNAEQA